MLKYRPESYKDRASQNIFYKKYRTIIGKTNKSKLLFVYNIVWLVLKSNGILNA